MNLLITGHRKHKLESYDIPWIQMVIDEEIAKLKEKHGYIRAYAGMASGVDLWFSLSCVNQEIPLVACLPFEGQENQMLPEETAVRKHCIEKAVEVRKVKNFWMVEQCDMGMIVWDGNKGGTHNVVQQLIEKKKPFIWINPVVQMTLPCFCLDK